MIREIKNAVVSFVALTVITGVVYPLAVTSVAQMVFPHQASGSLAADGKGSTQIGQNFSQPKYLWSRLSAVGYDAGTSSGTNYSMSNPALADAAKARIAALREADPSSTALVPIDLVTASGSGLDPDISLDAALYQAPRIAKARNMAVRDVESVIKSYVQGGHILSSAQRVNVLAVNKELDAR